MLTLISLPLMVACGGDDDGGSTVVDGVNVKNGKKLVSLSLIDESSSSSSSQGSANFKIKYDAQQRLSSIIIADKEVWNSSLNQYVKQDYELVTIDYDLRTLTFYNEAKYGFMLNNKGYVSQVGTCSCTYDAQGYLIGTESSNETWNLIYSDGDIVKSVVEKLVAGEIYSHYIYYGEDKTKGELYFTMNSESGKYNNVSNQKLYALVCFIAYQSGLFGKISNHIAEIASSSSKSAVFERSTNRSSSKVKYHCTFVYQ